MAFLETPRFPDNLRYGFAGGPGFNTQIITVDSGYEQRDRRWANARGHWQGEHGPHKQSDTLSLIAYFRAVGGMANGFRLKDWTDYQVSAGAGLLDAGIGTGLPTYQLRKVYTTGVLSESRPIKKPVTAALTRGGVAMVAGAGAGQYALDTATGIVTVVADASSNASSITVGATTQVVLAANPGTLIAGQKLYLTGFTGADAALVNGLAHTINSLTGTGPYTFTLSTVTTGKTITLGSGAGRKYPQATDALLWTGEFDVPVRFNSDSLQIQMVAYDAYTWANVEMIEVRV